MKLNDVVPWGRSLTEYKAMFSLTDADLNKYILGCADGPASFNAELSSKAGSQNGIRVVSVDPIYQFTREEVVRRIDETAVKVLAGVAKNHDDYIWKSIQNIDELEQVRMNAMKTFLADFEQGKNEGRYIDAALPNLPFSDNEFELALCSHCLFLYSEQLDEEMHLASIRELARVAHEVRVYPVLSITDNKPSRHLDVVMSGMRQGGFDVRLENVSYEFQKGATQMFVLDNRKDHPSLVNMNAT